MFRLWKNSNDRKRLGFSGIWGAWGQRRRRWQAENKTTALWKTHINESTETILTLDNWVKRKPVEYSSTWTGEMNHGMNWVREAFIYFIISELNTSRLLIFWSWKHHDYKANTSYEHISWGYVTRLLRHNEGYIEVISDNCL